MSVAFFPRHVDKESDNDVHEDDGDHRGVNGGRLRLATVNVLEDVLSGYEEAENGRRKQEKGKCEECLESV